MDGYPFPAMDSATAANTVQHHSTSANDVRFTLRNLAQQSWDQHLVDVHQSHKWLEGFFDNLQQGAKRDKANRPAMAELIKTPGRKRLAITTNGNGAGLGATANGAGRKDPVATLLFPSAHGSSGQGREKGGHQQSENAPPALGLGSPKRLSPMGKSSSRIPFAAGSPVRSPMRGASPRPQQPPQRNIFAPAPAPAPAVVAQQQKITQPPVAAAVEAAVVEMEVEVDEEVIEVLQEEEMPAAGGADLSNVMEEDEDEEAEMDAEVTPIVSDTSRFSNASTIQEVDEQANLSIIGEEAEEDDSVSLPPAVPAVAQPLPNTVGHSSSLVLPETQFSSPRLGLALSSPAVLPPSSHLGAAPNPGSPRARVVSTASSLAEEADEVAVPLNDAPSLLRTNSSTSTSAAPTTALGSSTPASASASTRTPGGSSISRFATSSLSSPPPAGTNSALRASTGAGGAGGQGTRQLNFVGLPKKSLGLGLGLGRSWGGSSVGLADSSQGSQSQSSQPSTTSTAATTAASNVPSATSANVPAAASGQQKRKSVEPADAEEAASKARRDALASRMKSMQARQSALPSNTAGARVSGINGAVATTTIKPVEPSSIFAKAPPPPPPAAPSAPAPITTATSNAGAALARRPSFLDRIKSFERSSASDVRPPSPSKIPSAISHQQHQQARPLSPPPKSPKRAIVSPQASKIVSPKVGMGMQLRSSPAPALVVQPKSPARPLVSAAIGRLQQTTTTTTTPKVSPPRGAGIMQRLDVDEQEDEEESEEESIRVVQQLQRPVSPIAALLDGAEAKRLVSLPAEPDAGEEEDQEEEEDGEVVEKGRGALASALEATRMPGGFGDEQEDDEVEVVSKPSTTTTLHKPSLHKKVSQSSLASSHSSQHSQGGNGGMLSNIFGGKGAMGHQQKKMTADGKVKSIQLAAAAAKKEQIEKERKQAQKEEREQKRLENLQRRQEEEREQERKIRAEGQERKRKEREEQQIKSSKIVRPKVGKVDDEPAKKRKVEPNAELKSSTSAARPNEIKKSSLAQQQSMRPGASANAHYQSSSLNSSQNRNPLASSQGRPFNAGPSSSTTTTPAHGLNKSQGQSSMIGVKFMAPPAAGSAAPPGRVAGNGKPFGTSSTNARPPPPAAVAPPAPAPRSEPEIELPDIDSEYSDSGDEGHDEKVKALPNWAQSPALAAALYRQQHVNPDDIFGPIPPLSMQEIFRTNSSRITKRTSSACWEGTDALTADDMARYNLAMGYTKASTSKQ